MAVNNRLSVNYIQPIIIDLYGLQKSNRTYFQKISDSFKAPGRIQDTINKVNNNTTPTHKEKFNRVKEDIKDFNQAKRVILADVRQTKSKIGDAASMVEAGAPLSIPLIDGFSSPLALPFATAADLAGDMTLGVDVIIDVADD